MTDQSSLTERILDHVIEQTQDHLSTLIELSARLEPRAPELIEAWTQPFRELESHVDTSIVNISKQAQLAQAVFGELKLGHLHQAFAHLGAWNHELANAGLPYDLAVKLMRAQQHATLKIALPAYKDNPHLPIVLDAIDDWFDGAVVVVAAAFVEAKPAPRQTPVAPLAPETRYIDATNTRVLGQLAGGMAHTLNDLFTLLIGQTELLGERASDYAVRDELKEIQNTANIGAQMVNRIQKFAGTRDETNQTSDVNLLLRDTAELTRFLWRDTAETQGIVIDVVKDFADVPAILAQPAQLEQALVALVINAIEALPNGGLVTLRTERKGNHVLISIIDNGVGMPDDVREHAHEPYFTTKPAPHVGLGLNHAIDIITKHQGTVKIDSAPQHGTTITLSLPLLQSMIDKKERKIMPTQRPARILVIDNEPSVRALLARLLTIKGHAVVSAESGIEGLDVFKKDKFDVVFTDLGMPEMSGWDVAKEIKKLNSKTLVALTTGWPIDLTPEELKAKSVDKVVSKPFDFPTLYAMADEAVAHNSEWP